MKNQSPYLTAIIQCGSSRWRRILCCALAAFPILAGPQQVRAAQRTWTGGGSDNNWGTAANWGGAGPANGDSIVFAGNNRIVNTNNLVGLNLSGITFNSSLFQFSGNMVTNSGGVLDNFGNNTNNLIMNLTVSQGFTNNAASTVLVFGGSITNLGNELSIWGAGNLYLNGVVGGGAGASLLGGGIDMEGSGTLRLAAANTFAGGIIINSGTVQLGNAGGIPGGAGKGDVTNNATLDLNGNSPTINGLFGSGTVDNAAGGASVTLTVGNSATNTGGVFFYGGTIQNTSGKISLTKVNTNTFLLGGSPIYSGATTISGGTLALTNSSSLPNSSSISVASGALFDVSQGAFSLAAGQTLTAGRATNGGPADVVGDPNSSGNLNIYKAGAAGTLTLSGALTLGGGVVNFDLGNNTQAGAGSNDLIAINGQLTLNNSTTFRLNPMVGAFAVGNYTLITNSTALVAGTTANLAVETPRGITATLDTTTFPGSVLVGISGSATPVLLTWSGAVSGDWDVNLTQNWLSNGVPDVFFNLDNVLFNDASSNFTVNLPSGVSPFSTTVNNSASNYVFAGVGSITGSGGFTKSGAAQVTFRNANTFLGNTIINGGTLQFDVGNASAPLTQIFYNGVTPGSLTMGGGTVTATSRANSTSYQLFSGTTFNAGGSIVFQPGRTSSSHPAIYLGAVTRTAGASVDMEPQTGSGGSQTDGGTGIFTANTNVNTTASGILGGYATWNAAFGTAEFARVNASAGAQGGTHIYGGATYVNQFANLTNTDMTADLATANNTNTMSVRFNSASARTLTLTGSNVITSGGVLVGSAVGANQSTITGGTALTSGNGLDLIVHQYDLTGNLLINSVISDNNGASIALTKTGGGTVILSAANTFSGPTFINSGTVQVGNNGTAGSIAASSSVVDNGTLAFKHTDAVTLALPVSGRGGLTQAGGSSLTLTANNSFSGATTVSAGTLQVGNGGTTGSLGSSSNLVNNGTVIFNHSDNVSFAGLISGGGVLVNQGAGTLALGSADTYSGATFVNNGKISLGANASISNSTAIVVAGGATFDAAAAGGLVLNGGTVNQVLSGAGTVNGNVAVSAGVGAGSQISPATNGAYGTLTLNNNLTLNGGTINFDISGSSKDLITVGGNLTLNSGTILLNVSGTIANGTYKLIGYAGTLGGSVGNLFVNGFSQPGQVAILSSTTAGEIDLVVETFSPVNLVWQGDGANNPWDFGVTADWTNSAGVAAVYNQFDNANFDDTSLNTFVNLTGILTPTHVTINGTVNSYTLQGTGTLAGGDLTVNNPNTTTILTQNEYGPTTVNAGTVAVGNGLAEGTLGSGTVTNKGALVFNEPSNTVVSTVISGPGSLTHLAPDTLSLAGNNTLSGPVTISSGTLQVGVGGGSGSLGTGLVTNNGTLEISRSGTLTVGNAITGSGQIFVDGPGTITLSGANSYAGNTYISNGIVKLGNASAVPSGGSTTGWLILDGGSTAGELDLNGLDQTVNALSGLTGTALGVVANDGGTGTNTLAIIEIADTTFNGTIVDKTGAAGGKVALAMNGPSVLTLTPGGAGSTFSGGTLINNGTISGGSSTTANATMLGSGPITFGTNGTLQMAGWTGTTTPDYGGIQNPLVIPANTVATVLGSCRAGLGLAPVSVNGPASSTLYYIVRYLRGNVGGNWTNFFGTLIASNNPTGADNHFRINTSAGFPNARLLLADGSQGGAFIENLVTGTPTIPIGELTGDANTGIALNGGGNADGQPAIFAVGGLNTTAEFDGSILNSHGITKVGTGSWLLTSANLTYTGSTTVSNGLLVLGASAALASSTPVTLASPGILDVSAAGVFNLGASVAQTLQGNGTLNGSLSAGASGTVSPGGANALATLTVTNAVTLGGTILMELNRTNSPGSNDMLVAASITAGGTLQVNNLGPDLHTGDTFKLFSVPVTGAFAVTNLPVTTGNGQITYVWTNNLAVDGTIQVLAGAPNLNPNPAPITFGVSGGTLSLSWPPDRLGWYLQAQTNVLGHGLGTNWVDVPGSSGVTNLTFSISPTAPAVFYRMSLNP